MAEQRFMMTSPDPRRVDPAPQPLVRATLVYSWTEEPVATQEFVAYGSPTDAAEAGRDAVRKFGDALERLADL